MENKIIFTGPVGAGKTAVINAISDIKVVSTEAKASDDVALRKASTTVAMDYGVLCLDDGRKVHLYGTPGQERFDFMWEILSEGAIGIVILVDCIRPDPLADLETYIRAFHRYTEKNGGPIVVGITRTDVKGSDAALIDSLHARLEGMNLRVPVLEIDGRSRKDIKQLLLVLLSLFDETAPRERPN